MASKGLFSSSGQYQIIFGTGLVNKVFDAFAKEADIEREEHVNHQDAAKEKLNPLRDLRKRFLIFLFQSSRLL